LRRVAQPPLGAVALDGAADPAGGGETQSDMGLAVGAVARLDDDGAARAGRGLGRRQEVGALGEALDGRRDGTA
jgi:hypothetical protein